MLEERNQTGRNGDHLFRRNVHIFHSIGRNLAEIATHTHHNTVVHKAVIFVELSVCLNNHKTLLFIGRQPIKMLAHFAFRHLEIRRNNKAIFIDLSKRRKRGDQTNVGTLWCFNRADPAIVRTMYVTHFESGAVAVEATRSEGRQATLVCKLGKRIGLVHELRELTTAKEILNHGGKRLGINQLLRSEVIDRRIKDGHAFFHEALDASKTHTALTFEQFAYRTNTPTSEVVDIIERTFTHANHQQIAQGFNHILNFQSQGRAFNTKLLLDFVATHAAEIKASFVEEEALDHLASRSRGGRIARTELLIQILECFVHRTGGVGLDTLKEETLIPRNINHADFLVSGELHALNHVNAQIVVAPANNGLRIGVNNVIAEHQVFKILFGEGFLGQREFSKFIVETQNLLVGFVAECTQKGGRQKLAAPTLAVEININEVASIKLRLNP